MIPSTPDLYGRPGGSDSQPWPFPPIQGAASIVEPVPPSDPVRAFPTNRLWRENWFAIDNAARDGLRITAMIRQMASVRPGMQVADIGAGGGFYSFRFARDVGDQGHVWAIDVDGRATSKVAWEAHARGLGNLTAVRARRGELGLEGLALDVVVMLETGMLNTCEPAIRVPYLQQIAAALRPGGRLVFHEVSYDARQRDLWSSLRGCRQPTADEVLALARPYFELERRDAVSTGEVWRGYLLLLRRR